MLDYDEELKNFQPVPELEETKMAIYDMDITDLTDVMQQMMGDKDIKRDEQVGML